MKTRHLAATLLLAACSACSARTEPAADAPAAPEGPPVTSFNGAAPEPPPLGGGRLGAGPPPRSAGDPALLAPDPIHDFGAVYAGAVLDHTFALETAGGSDLVIQSIKPGCGCTVATPVVVGADGSRRPYELETALAPGTRLELDVTFDTTGKFGPQNKPINVYCNDPLGVVRLGVHAQLERFLTADPPALDLGRLRMGESSSASARLIARGGDPVRLSVDPSRLLSGLSVDLAPVEPDADGRSSVWRADVTLGGEDMRAGRVYFQVLVDSDIPSPGAADDAPGDVSPAGGGHGGPTWLGGALVVQAEVLDLYVASPRQLFFGPIGADTTASRVFRLTSFDAEHPLVDPVVRLEDADGDALEDGRYHVSIAPADAPDTWSVELLVDGLPAGTGLFEGRVVLETANPDRPTVEVPFKGIVR